MKKYKRIMRLSVIVLLLVMQYNTSVFAIDHLSINQQYHKNETQIMFLNPFTINDEETNEDDNQGRKVVTPEVQMLVKDRVIIIKIK